MGDIGRGKSEAPNGIPRRRAVAEGVIFSSESWKARIIARTVFEGQWIVKDPKGITEGGNSHSD